MTNCTTLAIGAIAGSYRMLPPADICRPATWRSW